jgi:5'(3')-deoxyribonucleotidase
MHADTIDPALLGFDFDGVIADTAETFLRLACEKHGLCGISQEEITDFDVEQCIDIPEEAVTEIFRDILVDSVGSGLKPMSGAVEVLTELTENTTVTVVTARPLSAPVHDWLEHVLPEATLPKIRVMAMGAHDDKPRHILGYGLRYFIDDRAETCIQLSQNNIHPIVFSQPWNRNRHQFQAVHSWQEIRTLCL